MGNNNSHESPEQRPKSYKLPSDSIPAPPDAIVEVDLMLLSDRQCYTRLVESLKQHGFAILRTDIVLSEFIRQFFLTVFKFFQASLDHKSNYEWKAQHCIGYFATADGETFQFKLPGSGVRLTWPPAPYDPDNRGLIAYYKKMQELGTGCIEAIEKVVLDKHEHTIKEVLDFDPVPANTFANSVLKAHLHHHHSRDSSSSNNNSSSNSNSNATQRMCGPEEKISGMLHITPVVPVPGLQVYNEAMRKWFDLESVLRPFTDIVVVVGTDLELITNQYFKAPLTRVLSVSSDRVSMPFSLRARAGFEDRFKGGSAPLSRQPSGSS